jgi:hypothetical protein
MAAIASAYWVQFGLAHDPSGGERPIWPRHDPVVDRLMHFTNSGVIVLKRRLDLWVWALNRQAATPAAPVQNPTGVPVIVADDRDPVRA